MFDSSYVTKMTDSGRAINFTFGETTTTETNSSDKKPKSINLWDPTFADDFTALSDGCKCYSCSTPHTRGYIHHLLNAHEMLALVLLMRYVIYSIAEPKYWSLITLISSATICINILYFSNQFASLWMMEYSRRKRLSLWKPIVMK